MNEYIYVMRNAFNFSSRDTRRQFWMFTLIYIIISIVATALDVFMFGVDLTDESNSSSGPIGLIVGLVHLIPSLATGVRRLHDIDWRGWWLFIMLIPLLGIITLIVLFCKRGTAGPNRFGDDPYGADPRTFS